MKLKTLLWIILVLAIIVGGYFALKALGVIPPAAITSLSPPSGMGAGGGGV
jgi:hypothetical protein